ncbi:MAG TPA: DUF6319 family protein [Pseudonocardiaceae bacterium]
MPSGPPPLSATQIDQLRADVAGGSRPMVWFTPAAVGVAAGRSAKVVSLADPPEGDYIQVLPTGSHDELSFSPNELTMEKPPRRKKTPAPPPEPAAPPPAPPMDELLVVRERPATRKPAPAAAAPAERRPKTRKPPAPITVTLSSTSEGEWTVEVQSGSRRTVRPQPVGAGAVASAARALGGDIEAAIEGALVAARDRQQERVARLEADLAAARQALADLV